jgi:hypothetical protein
MKKGVVLVSLFILPIVVYLFFATGVNNFISLPTITKSIPDIVDLQQSKDSVVQLQDKITILGFPGKSILKNKGNLFNFNQKIYNKYKGLNDFQVVFILPKGLENDVAQLKKELYQLTDFSRYFFVYTEPAEIQAYFKKLGLIGNLDAEFGTTNVYIVDKNRNLRGRKGHNKKGESEYKEGYNTISAAELHNEMSDDFKILVYEYRSAFKKNNINRKNSLKINEK